MPYKDKDKQLAYQRQHYSNNKEKYNARSAEYKKQNRDRIRELIRKAKDVPCMDCGGEYPTRVMEFDHCEGTKLANVADMIQSSPSILRVQDEIAKCEVVCANCHRIRTIARDSRTVLQQVHAL